MPQRSGDQREVGLEQRIRTTGTRFTAVSGGRPYAPILLEASTESERVAQCREGLGHELLVADPNQQASGDRNGIAPYGQVTGIVSSRSPVE